MAAAPDEARRQIETTASNLFLEARAGEVVEALRDRGKRSVLLRGPTTERWLYDDGLRRYSDVDLLVDPAGFYDCERVLAEMGFERSPIERVFTEGRPEHASTWSRKSATIDLHRTLVGLSVSAEEAWTVLFGNTETWTLGRVDAQVLNPAARSLVLALHMAQHGRGFARTREDLERALARVPESVWLDAADLARRLRAETSMAAGLLSVTGGQHLSEALGLRLEGEAPVDGSTSFHAAQGMVWLMQTKGARAKARFFLRKLLPPAAVMRARVPSARTGRISLLRAYCVRLVRIGWHMPHAVWGLVRLRRKRRRL